MRQYWTTTCPWDMATASYPNSSLDRKTRLPLQCTLCLRNLPSQDSTILSCSHVVCSECFQSTCVHFEEELEVQVVSCPVCGHQVELASSEVSRQLKSTYTDARQLLQSGLSPVPLPRCDLCTDNEMAVSHCEVCSCYLCDLCEQSHRRQRRTSDHPLNAVDGIPYLFPFNGETASPYGSLNRDRDGDQPDVCKAHKDKPINLFCESCNVPLCESCTAEHDEHNLLSLAEVDTQYSELLRSLVSRTKPLVSSMNESMVSIELLLSRVQERAESVAKEICDDIDARVRALHEHKRLLLTQLEAIKQHKENTLELQLEEMKKVLDEVNVSCSMTTAALRDEATPTSIFSAKIPLAAHLEELVCRKQECIPEEDDYIRFCPKLPAGQCRGFNMFGVLDARGPSAAHSVVEGEGLFEARQRRMATFTVIIHDRYGQRRLSGGDKVEARMQSRTGTIVNAQVTDNGDGTYLVSYTPELVGEHRLSVLVDRKHIRSSPFVVNVRPRRRKHRGVFHCCTFCSSGGKKHVRCGCGGVMPGGYSGCGHGHAGHPGSWHWSCCGHTVEQSDCRL